MLTKQLMARVQNGGKSQLLPRSRAGPLADSTGAPSRGAELSQEAVPPYKERVSRDARIRLSNVPKPCMRKSQGSPRRSSGQHYLLPLRYSFKLPGRKLLAIDFECREILSS
eukprot:GHUV01034551.1.p2 GENE.GHUV01034551.1~~GHUV01034551.1.p2  ORF type:complete len:112 (-),score=8.51 GHUV01034551.1:355-690(-)